ncbi:hypothetical protein BGZ95_005718, partial [Linnemannia exigua]
MFSSRKILCRVAFVATVALIGLMDPAMGAPAPAAADSIASGPVANLFKRTVVEGDYCAT